VNNFDNLPNYDQSGINCETNAAISTQLRALQEAMDLKTWFNVSAGLQERLLARTASFCLERSGHFDGFDRIGLGRGKLHRFVWHAFVSF
jgi:hypothetical protein